MNRHRLMLGAVLATAVVLSACAPGPTAKLREQEGAPAAEVVWTDAGPVRGTVTGKDRLFQGSPMPHRRWASCAGHPLGRFGHGPR
jgi:hypothetical protein